VVMSTTTTTATTAAATGDRRVEYIHNSFVEKN
jgi:hypothetical protein